MMEYPVDLKPDGHTWMVTFPDIPEAITGGYTRERAMNMAHDALITAFEFYYDSRRQIPLPSKIKPTQECVVLAASLSIKIMLLNEMTLQKVRPGELATRLGTSPQVVNRLTDLHHTSKVDALAKAFLVLGARLDFHLSDLGKPIEDHPNGPQEGRASELSTLKALKARMRVTEVNVITPKREHPVLRAADAMILVNRPSSSDGTPKLHIAKSKPR